MATLLELASDIVSSHASTTPMSSEELVQEIQKVYAVLQGIQTGKEIVSAPEEAKPVITVKQAFKKNEVICLECGKSGFKTLTRHLNIVHNMMPREYRKQYGIPSKQSLTAKSFSEARRQMAEERGLAENLAKAREVRMANINAKKAALAKAAKPKAAKKTAPAKVAKPKVAKNTKIPF
jgi:predicted transcriptional regulator